MVLLFVCILNIRIIYIHLYLFNISSFFQFSSVIDLNVGGRYFTTLLSTLTKDPDSMLAAMFSGRHPVSKDKDGRYFIDADGDVFSHIIEYLRFQKLPPAQMSVKVHEYAVYFGVQELSEILSSFASVDREENLEKIRSFYKDFPKIFKEIIYVIKQRKSYLRQFKVSLPPLIAADQFRDSVCCKCSNGEKIEMTEKDPDGKALRFLIEHELCKRGYKAQSGTTTCENTVFKNHKCGLIVCYFILTFYE